MSIESSRVGHVQLPGHEKSVSIKIEKNTSVNKPQSATVDISLAERQSIKAEPSVEGRKSIASLVNEKKDTVGLKIDISV